MSIPSDVYVTEIFPKLKLSEIIMLAEIQPYLIPATKEYLVKLGRKYGMKIESYQDFMNMLRIGKKFEDFVLEFSYSLYDFLIRYNEDFLNGSSTIDLYEFLNEIEPMLISGKSEFIKDLNANTSLIKNQLFLEPHHYQDGPLFRKFRVFLDPIIYEIFAKYIRPYTVIDEDNEETYEHIVDQIEYILDENVKNLTYRR